MNTYDADDANADASTGTTDILIRLQMTGADTLSWTYVQIRLSVGDTVHTCSVGGGDACTISQQGGDNGNAWEPGEFIFLSESGTDICSDVGCMVGISVTYNGDTVAGEVARALAAERLVFLTDVAGVMDGNGRVVPRLDRRRAANLLRSGVVRGGMIPKLDACLRALETSLYTDIIDGREPNALLDCLQGRATGTRIIGNTRGDAPPGHFPRDLN